MFASLRKVVQQRSRIQKILSENAGFALYIFNVDMVASLRNFVQLQSRILKKSWGNVSFMWNVFWI